MEQTQKWYESKIVRMALALILGGLSFFGVSYGTINVEDLDRASTVYPEVANGIAMIQAGQWASGLLIIFGAVLLYFRVYKTTKVIALKGGDTSYGKAA